MFFAVKGMKGLAGAIYVNLKLSLIHILEWNALIPDKLWYIWKARNLCCFDDKVLSPYQVSSFCLGCIKSFPQDKTIRIRQVVVEVVDKTLPWGYFDGSTSGDPKICGAGGVLFISEDHSFTFKAGLGFGTNNFAELIGLKLLLTLSLHHNYKQLQIFGDSELVINWASGKYRIQNILLEQILLEVHRLADLFENVHFMHIFREKNTIADKLAKDGSNIITRSWQILEHRAVDCFNTVMFF